MAEDFGKAVELGVRLSKRLYFGKDRAVSPPKRPAMEKSSESYLPTAPMVYAVIFDPAIVDNPDIPSYQPHVHGRCDPPALIPLQMNEIALEADCYLDTAFVTVSGSWRVHCVMGSRSCDCCIAIPMGEQGSVLGIEVDVPRKSYRTQLIATDDKENIQEVACSQGGGFLKDQIYNITIPKVDGGSNLSIKVYWAQKLLYHAGQLSLEIPFNFPEYVTPVGKKLSKKERIQLNVDCGTGTEILCHSSSQPLKELKRGAGKLSYVYESEVFTWSSTDFLFSYTVSSSHMLGVVLLQSPSVLDVDQREIFCLYVLPGSQHDLKVFKKQVVFVVDISKSMRGRPIEDTKKVISAALFKLDPGDSFDIIAFNEETYLYSSSMESATREAIENAVNWIDMNFVPGGGTNILLPLKKALELLTHTHGSLPIIFLMTDGAVEDERVICDLVRRHSKDGRSICPRLYTFGIGSFCNHYFLQMLATMTRGGYGAAFFEDSIEHQMQGLLIKAFSGILVNISIDNIDDLAEAEVYPSCIPDLLSESPLTVSGRWRGNFPSSLKVRGMLAGSNNFVMDMKVQRVLCIPLDRIFTKQQVDVITAEAWFSKSKQLEKKAAKWSVQAGVISEYTHMILLETKRGRKGTDEATGAKEAVKAIVHEGQRIILLRNPGVGFGNLAATAENIPPGREEENTPEPAEMLARAARNCCGEMCGRCCCRCCIDVCSRMNDQCAIVLAQLCTALACFGCMDCCADICCSEHN